MSVVFQLLLLMIVMGAHFMDLTTHLLIELLVIHDLILLILVLSLTLGVYLEVLKNNLSILALSVLVVSWVPLLVHLHLIVSFLHNPRLSHLLLLLLMLMISSRRVHLLCVPQRWLSKSRFGSF